MEKKCKNTRVHGNSVWLENWEENTYLHGIKTTKILILFNPKKFCMTLIKY